MEVKNCVKLARYLTTRFNKFSHLIPTMDLPRDFGDDRGKIYC